MAPNLVTNPTTTLEAATNLRSATNLRPRDAWSDKPLFEKRATKPLAKRKVGAYQRQMMTNVVIPPDFSLTWALAALGPLIIWYHPCKY